MFGLGNWVKQSVSAGGTGNLTVAAITGFDTFASQFGDGTTTPPARYFRYVISDGNNFETGIGHMSATTTLVRDKIEMTLASGTMSRFPGAGLTVSTSAFVFCDMTSEAAADPVYFPDATSTTAGQGVGPMGVSAGAGSVSSTGFAAFYDWWWPFQLPVSGVYSAIAIEFGTPVGTNFQLAIYQSGLDGYPANQLAATASTLVVASGWQKNSFAANVYLRAKEVYWLALTQDATNPIYNSNNYAIGLPVYRWPGGANFPGNCVYKANASYAALPDPAPAFPAVLAWNGNTSTTRPNFSLTRTA